MPKLHYGGEIYELSPTVPGENIVNRIDQALVAGRALLGDTTVPTDTVLGLVTLKAGNYLLFTYSGALPIAIETDVLPDPATFIS
jgi:hypothetical protein